MWTFTLNCMESLTAQWGELLTPEEFEELAAQGHQVSYPAGAVVIRQGEHQDFVLYIVKGYTKAVLPATNEIPEIHGPGYVVGELASLTGAPRSADVQAITEVEVLMVPGDVWREFIATHPRSACAHYSNLAKRFLRSDSAQGLSFTSSEYRVANALLKLANIGMGTETDDGLEIRGFKQQDIAAIAKVSRESASAVLGKLRERNAISIGRARFTIHDISEIKRLVSTHGPPGQRKAV